MRSSVPSVLAEWARSIATCAVVQTGDRPAAGTTDGSGNATIRVLVDDGLGAAGFVVVAKLATDPKCRVSVEGGAPIECTQAGSDPDAAYAAWTSDDAAPPVGAGAIETVALRQVQLASGSVLPARIVEVGSGLLLVTPEYVNRAADRSQYAVVVEATDDRTVTATVPAPSGMVVEAPRQTVRTVGGKAAMQFTISGTPAGSTAGVSLALDVREDGKAAASGGRVPVPIVEKRKD